MTEMNREDRYKTISRVNWICTAMDTILSVFKLSIGLFVRSPGLIADGLHSLSDLATDVLALILGKLAQHGPDEDHPYGHARYETMGTAVLGTVLIMVALGIGLENVNALVRGDAVSPHWVALIVVGVSIISKEALFHFTMKYARMTRSNLLEANAWHSRSDSLSSVAVFIGIVGSLFGYPIIEYLAAIIVAALIGSMGFKLAWNAMQDLIDRGVPFEQQEKYKNTLNSVYDINDVHLLRSRLMGNDVMIDAHIQVAPTLSVSEAHQINDFATALLKQQHTEITDITLHIDFEADHRTKKTKLMPKRYELEVKLSEVGIINYEQIYLHYEEDLLNVELQFGVEIDTQNMLSSCEKLTQETAWINSIKIYSKIN